MNCPFEKNPTPNTATRNCLLIAKGFPLLPSVRLSLLFLFLHTFLFLLTFQFQAYFIWGCSTRYITVWRHCCTNFHRQIQNKGILLAKKLTPARGSIVRMEAFVHLCNCLLIGLRTSRSCQWRTSRSCFRYGAGSSDPIYLLYVPCYIKLKNKYRNKSRRTYLLVVDV